MTQYLLTEKSVRNLARDHDRLRKQVHNLQQAATVRVQQVPPIGYMLKTGGATLAGGTGDTPTEGTATVMAWNETSGDWESTGETVTVQSTFGDIGANTLFFAVRDAYGTFVPIATSCA